MIEEVKELNVESHLYTLVQWKPFGEIEIAPEEIRTAQGVAAKPSKLTSLRAVAAEAGPRAGVNGG
jgi:hypothetical protein